MQTSPELADDARYSQVSPAAVVALLLGLASPLAFIGPLFFFLPAAAVGVALVALGGIRRAEGALTGQTLARIAIALALACMAAALVRGSVRDRLVERQAVEAAKVWLQLLADGRIQEARAMLTSDAEAAYVPTPVMMGQQQTPPEEVEELIITGLRNDALTLALAGQRDPGVFESVSPPAFTGPKATVLVNFGIEDAQAGGHRHVGIQMVRSRQFELEGLPWRVDRWNTGEAHGAH